MANCLIVLLLTKATTNTNSLGLGQLPNIFMTERSTFIKFFLCINLIKSYVPFHNPNDFYGWAISH